MKEPSISVWLSMANDLLWIPFTSMRVAAFSINLDSCNQKRCISLSSAMEEMQLGESVALDMEEMIVQQMMTESMMDMLTDKQKELIYALYFEKQTYQEYADIHGISSAAVNNMRNKAVAKLRASLEELAESTEKKKLRKK